MRRKSSWVKRRHLCCLDRKSWIGMVEGTWEIPQMQIFEIKILRLRHEVTKNPIARSCFEPAAQGLMPFS